MKLEMDQKETMRPDTASFCDPSHHSPSTDCSVIINNYFAFRGDLMGRKMRYHNYTATLPYLAPSSEARTDLCRFPNLIIVVVNLHVLVFKRCP